MQRQAPVFSGWIALTKFPDFPDCAGVLVQRRTKNPHWENLGRVQYGTGGRRSRKFARSTRPPTQMQPQAMTARTQQVRSATRMSSCFRSVPECRDVDASAPCQSRLTVFERERRRAVACDRRTERADGYSICRRLFRSRPGPMFRFRHAALPTTDSAQKPEESTVTFSRHLECQTWCLSRCSSHDGFFIRWVVRSTTLPLYF